MNFIDTFFAYFDEEISNFLQYQPDNMSTSTDNVENVVPRSVNWKDCHVCFETTEEENMVALPCDHYWCLDCLSRACSGVKHDIDKSIVCDDKCDVPLQLALEVLPEAESKRLKSKLEEFEIPSRERFYCANKDCGEFIPPVSQPLDILAECEKCGHSTCKLCRALDHEGECAGPTKEDEQTLALIEKEQYQQCSQCCRVVERTQGCSHMTCPCGHEFCYHCGKPILACNGCGHLEPDILAEVTNDPAIPVESWEMVEQALLGLRIMSRPPSPTNLTSWFNFTLRAEGYRGPSIILGNDGSVGYILGPDGMPTLEELDISDLMLFREFETARLEVHADGTSTLYNAEEDSDSEHGEEWDDSVDWAM
ncbi:hypothetical protein KCU65_g10010, partial [Aureobasidium melanogenum]